MELHPNKSTRRRREYGVKSPEPRKNARKRTLESNVAAVILAFALAAAALFTTACTPSQQGEEPSATSGIEDEPDRYLHQMGVAALAKSAIDSIAKRLSAR